MDSQGLQSDQRSTLRTDVETLCIESTKLIDPWFSSEFRGTNAIYTALSGLSCIFKDRAYEVSLNPHIAPPLIVRCR